MWKIIISGATLIPHEILSNSLIFSLPGNMVMLNKAISDKHMLKNKL